MDAIFASKLYKTSRRKDKIASALQDPVNTELVQQLKSYLSDEVQEKIQSKPEFIEPDFEKPIMVDNNTGSEDANVDRNEGFAPSRRSTPLAPDIQPSEVPEANKESTEDKEEIPMDKFHAPEKPEADEQPAEVEESVKIEASNSIYSPTIEKEVPRAQVDAEAIKGTLNVRDDTKGVSRIFVRDNELWIYYQDKVNLNSVMEPVIAVLNSTGFTNLEFNRLARTENAIVFEISCVYNQIEPVTEEK